MLTMTKGWSLKKSLPKATYSVSFRGKFWVRNLPSLLGSTLDWFSQGILAHSLERNGEGGTSPFLAASPRMQYCNLELGCKLLMRILHVAGSFWSTKQIAKAGIYANGFLPNAGWIQSRQHSAKLKIQTHSQLSPRQFLYYIYHKGRERTLCQKARTLPLSLAYCRKAH